MDFEFCTHDFLPIGGPGPYKEAYSVLDKDGQKAMDTATTQTDTRGNHGNNDRLELKFLASSQIPMIDEALAAVGEFGEVRLIVERGRLRFVVTQKSFDAQKWQPGDLSRRAKLTHLSF